MGLLDRHQPTDRRQPCQPMHRQPAFADDEAIEVDEFSDEVVEANDDFQSDEELSCSINTHEENTESEYESDFVEDEETSSGSSSGSDGDDSEESIMKSEDCTDSESDCEVEKDHEIIEILDDSDVEDPEPKSKRQRTFIVIDD